MNLVVFFVGCSVFFLFKLVYGFLICCIFMVCIVMRLFVVVYLFLYEGRQERVEDLVRDICEDESRFFYLLWLWKLWKDGWVIQVEVDLWVCIQLYNCSSDWNYLFEMWQSNLLLWGI